MASSAAAAPTSIAKYTPTGNAAAGRSTAADFVAPLDGVDPDAELREHLMRPGQGAGAHGGERRGDDQQDRVAHWCGACARAWLRAKLIATRGAFRSTRSRARNVWLGRTSR